VADATHDGYLSLTDWDRFNEKEPPLGNPSSNGQVLSSDTLGNRSWIDAVTGSGTVTSVGLSAPNIFSVSGSPVTTSGTLGLSLATQTANRIFAGPTTGSAATPTFRALVSGDIPALSYEVPLTFDQSVVRSTNTIRLSGDSATPGNSKYYGTNGSGTKGYFALPAGFSGNYADLTFGPTDNITSIPNRSYNDLQDLPILVTTPTVGDVFALKVKEFTGASAAITRTGVSGNARGIGALDLSPFRSSADNVASGIGSVVIGVDSKASGSNAIAIGGALASGANSFAYGQLSSAIATNSVALGQNTHAIGTGGAFALGIDASARGYNSIAFSSGTAPGQWAVAFPSSYAVGSYSLAHGYTFAQGYASATFGQGAGTYPVIEGTVTGSTIGSITGFAWSDDDFDPSAIYRPGDLLMLVDYDDPLGAPITATIDTVDASSITLTTSPGNGDYVIYPDGSGAAGDYAQQSYSSSAFRFIGDAQESKWILTKATTDDTATRLTTDQTGVTANNQIRIFTGQVRAFTVDCVGLADDGTTYRKISKGFVRNSAGTVSISGLVEEKWVNSGASSWSVAVSADNTDKLLAVTVIGAAATNIRWIAHVSSTEIAWFPPSATFTNNASPTGILYGDGSGLTNLYGVNLVGQPGKSVRRNALDNAYEAFTPGTGMGDMLKADNLSGLANYTTARSNLGLGTLATQNGTFSGTSSGTNTGDQTSVSGNAGTATALQTARAIYGNNFDGSSALNQIIASTYGGTGNGFTKFTGPTTSEKTKTVRDAADTILELGGSYTPSGTWTSMPLTTPKVTTGINDANGNSMLAFTATASAVDGFTFTNAATANPATVTMAATGSDSNINIALTPKGTGAITTSFPTQVSGTLYGTSLTTEGQIELYTTAASAKARTVANRLLNFATVGGDRARLTWGGNAQVVWTSVTSSSSDQANGTNADTGLFRNAAGVLEVNSGTVGTYRDLRLRSVKHEGATIANLPGSPTTGQVATITDGDASLAWGATAVNSGAGATKYLVWYNGTNWTVVGK
jgi:hypothetical protein